MYRSELLAQAGLVHATSDIEDGNMAFSWGTREDVAHNRVSFLRQLGARPEQCTAMALEHGTEIREASATNAGRGMLAPETNTPSCDALVTRARGLGLFLTSADCLPITLFDPERLVLALVHAGWRGVDALLPALIVRSMRQRHNCQPHNLLVNIGPCVHGASYILPKEETLRRKTELDPRGRWRPYVKEVSEEEVAIDLVSYATAQMLEEGIVTSNLEIVPIDVATSPRFFSHTRSKRTGEAEGRFATLALMP